MAKIKISNNDYNMKFSLGFWEKIKNVCGVTQSNIQEKLNEDFGKNGSLVIQYGIFYGIPVDERPKSINEMEPSLDTIKNDLDTSVIDAIEETYIEGLSKAQRKIVEEAKKIQDEEITSISKKKSSD